MLWYKGWLETRFRLVFSLIVITLMFVLQAYAGDRVEARALVLSAGISMWLLCVFLAAAGIATQQSLQAAKGLHGSTLFTLTLPVSRLRLMAVRATLGWLEMAGGVAAVCCLLWFLFPVIRASATPREMAEYTGVLIVCGTGFYCIPVLLATFLDDIWRVWGSFLCLGAIWWLAAKIPAPAALNILFAIGDGSPLLAHRVPWAAMAVSVGLAAVLLFAALKIAEAREY